MATNGEGADGVGLSKGKDQRGGPWRGRWLAGGKRLTIGCPSGKGEEGEEVVA